MAWDPGKALSPKRPRHTRWGLCVSRYRRKRGIKLPREIVRWLRGFGFILFGVVLLVVAILFSWVPRIGWLLLVITGLIAGFCIVWGAKELGVEL
jgi:hypothetical protein